jgi:hypothetical protein
MYLLAEGDTGKITGVRFLQVTKRYPAPKFHPCRFLGGDSVYSMCEIV